MNLTDALKVVDQIEKYRDGGDFPTEKQILDALFKLRDALVNAACITYDEKGQMQATAATKQAMKNARRDLPQGMHLIAARQRALPVEVQLAVNSQLNGCGEFLKPVLSGRGPDNVETVFKGLLEALVSVAEIGVTGRRDPRIVVPGERLN